MWDQLSELVCAACTKATAFAFRCKVSHFFHNPVLSNSYAKSSSWKQRQGQNLLSWIGNVAEGFCSVTAALVLHLFGVSSSTTDLTSLLVFAHRTDQTKPRFHSLPTSPMFIYQSTAASPFQSYLKQNGWPNMSLGVPWNTVKSWQSNGGMLYVWFRTKQK